MKTLLKVREQLNGEFTDTLGHILILSMTASILINSVGQLV